MQIIESLVQIFTLISEHSSDSGFGINTNIFETNVINIAMLVGIVIYLGKPFLTSTLQTRQEKVLVSIQEAEEKLEQANTRSNCYFKNILNKYNKDKISTANKVRESILEQGELDIERLAATGKASIANAENLIRKQIQQQIAALALKRVVLQLKGEMTSDMQSKIIDNNIRKLGGQL
uniref:ATP synthase CFO B subunit subunit I n=1 Tax=Madagascaria erythrocladioides TaxID=753684 RepID=UPI001FCE039F|nr:ATP synthase CFO B subunit subunit I [Madagascaria erythrocladioides]UNJ16543.1 ATP synthase CFO B subunit subunit I [Madagascaria erythrocladioides]